MKSEKNIFPTRFEIGAQVWVISYETISNSKFDVEILVLSEVYAIIDTLNL